MKEIVVAGGCFWGVEEYFRRVKGIVDTKSGYSQGHKLDATYQEVCTGKTGHTEAVWLTYEDTEVSLEKIAELLFRIINPTSLNKQGNDVGNQYRTGFYVIDEEDIETINEYIVKKQKEFNKKIVVEVEPVKNFIPAEDYHQMYLIKNPGGYCHVNMNALQREEKKDIY